MLDTEKRNEDLKITVYKMEEPENGDGRQKGEDRDQYT